MAAEEKIKETIEVTNMTCVGCARTIENELRKFSGIEYTVSFADKNIILIYSPEDYTQNDFEKAVELHGYRIKGKTY